MTHSSPAQANERKAILALLVASALWGMSFNWNKEAQEMVGQRLAADLGDERFAALGPAGFLAIRFPIAAILWAIVFRQSLRGWTAQTVISGVFAGGLLAGGMLLQHYGLSYTSESLSAFLTSLTVLFTPILGVTLFRQKVGGVLWASVACATLGVGLMTLAREEGRFDIGALLGLLCAVVFSGHILAVDYFGKRESPPRFTLAQFVVAGSIFWVFLLIHDGGVQAVTSGALLKSLESPRLLWLTGLGIVFATLMTFGLMFRYQPLTTPTRAALTYLTEPLFATTYAWLAAGRTISTAAMLGGLLIVVGNVLAEVLGRRNVNVPSEPAVM